MEIVVVVVRQPELLQIVDALGPPRCLPRCLDRRQQERDQYGDDRDHDEKLNQGEPLATRSHGLLPNTSIE
jgi:hypothetical protein